MQHYTTDTAKFLHKPGQIFTDFTEVRAVREGEKCALRRVRGEEGGRERGRGVKQDGRKALPMEVVKQEG